MLRLWQSARLAIGLAILVTFVHIAPMEAEVKVPTCGWTELASHAGHEVSDHDGLIQWTENSGIFFEKAMNLYQVNISGTRLERIIDGYGDYRREIYFSNIPPPNDSLSFDVSSVNRRIVFSPCHPSEFEVMTAKIDGSLPQRLGKHGALAFFPVWSPDGKRIAFISDRTVFGLNRSNRLYVMDSDGTDVQRLAPSVDPQISLYPPAWSPDGEYIAFTAYTHTWGKGVYTVNVDSSELTWIAESMSRPSWSPDGSRLAFINSNVNGEALYTIGFDGSDRRLVSTLKYSGEAWSPTWSPSGSDILVGCGTVCVLDADDGSLRGMSSTILRGGSIAVWSPDGSMIAVLMSQQLPHANGSIVLYTMAKDGTNLKVLVRGGRSLVAANSGWQDLETRVTSCSEGFVVSEPEKNPGLIGDCVALSKLKEAIAADRVPLPPPGVENLELRVRDENTDGKVVMNWSPGTPIEQWEGIEVDGVCVSGALPHEDRCKLFLNWRLFEPRPDSLPVVLVSPRRRVTGLDLSSQPTSGVFPNQTITLRQLPPEISLLTGLKKLDLSGNENPYDDDRLLYGAFPMALVGLSNLQVLDLKHNSLEGNVPPELGNLDSLRVLDLGNNRLSGEIPATFGKLRSLQKLSLAENRITGNVPVELGNLTNLRTLWLQDNELTGRPSANLGDIRSLTDLKLSHNLFECLPAELVYKQNLAASISNHRAMTCVSDTYLFQVSELTEIGQIVGAVSVNGSDTAAYSITAGNNDKVFAIDSATGELTVSGALSHEVTPSYTLRVEEQYSESDAAPAIVEIIVISKLEPCLRDVAIPDPKNNPDLVNDCAYLLAMADALRGMYHILNWSPYTPIDQWNGVSVGGFPRRVEVLDLSLRGLYVHPEAFYEFLDRSGWLSLHDAGGIPPEIGELSGLRVLDISFGFAGEIPSTLSNLHLLEQIKLPDMHGCIPRAWRDVEIVSDANQAVRFCE